MKDLNELQDGLDDEDESANGGQPKTNLTLKIFFTLALSFLITFFVLGVELINKKIVVDLGLKDPKNTDAIALQLYEDRYDAEKFLKSVMLAQESRDLENELIYRNSLRNYKIRAFELQHFQTKVLFYLNLFLVLSSSLMALLMIQSPSKEVVKIAGNEYSGRSIGVVLLLVVFIYYSLFVREVYQPDELWYITNMELMNGQYVSPGIDGNNGRPGDNE